MAKSTGNLVFVHDVLAEHSAAALRVAILDRRWWEDWEYDERLVDDAEARVLWIRQAAMQPGTADGHARALEALCDDLDVPTALVLAEQVGGWQPVVIDVLGLRHRGAVRRTVMLPAQVADGSGGVRRCRWGLATPRRRSICPRMRAGDGVCRTTVDTRGSAGLFSPPPRMPAVPSARGRHQRSHHRAR